MDSSDLLSGREVIVEFFRLGNFIKITAMDTESLTEISVQAPIGTSENACKNMALKRLAYVLKKKTVI